MISERFIVSIEISTRCQGCQVDTRISRESLPLAMALRWKRGTVHEGTTVHVGEQVSAEQLTRDQQASRSRGLHLGRGDPWHPCGETVRKA